MDVDYGYEIVTSTTTCTENVEATLTAPAPAGKVAIGGGWLSSYPADHVAIGDNYPEAAGAGWSVRVKLLGNTGITPAPSKDVTVYAVCIDVS